MSNDLSNPSCFHLQRVAKSSNFDEPEKQVEKDFPDQLPAPDYKDKLDWFYIVFFTFVHLGAIYGFFLPGKSILTTFYGELLIEDGFKLSSPV
jgi:hypothetical protein